MIVPDYLLIFQSCAMTVMALMALLLLSSRFFQPHTTLNYEKSRWLLFTAMLLAVVHYLLQIFLGFRAASDELGALVNMISIRQPSIWCRMHRSAW